MKIGNINIKGIAALAPMAGITDKAFREICKDFGASFVVSEMISSKAISFNDQKTLKLMELSTFEHPVSIQIFGNEPYTMAQAAKFALNFSPDMIDINMGCPAPKVSKNGAGSALLRNPLLCYKIVYAVKNSVNIPVTVKIRKGWDAKEITALEVSKLCEKAGADALTIHGRTREDMYSGKVDLEIIKEIKKSISIPVIGNGDISSIKDAKNMISETNCDMVMIGRGALGNPWIFNEINLSNTKIISIYEKIETMLKHIKLICKYKGEKTGIKEARKHAAWYIKGLPGAAEFRRKCNELSTLEDLIKLTKEILKY